MYKLDEFMAELERKNPAQPEFIQAAREVIASVIDVVNANPLYLKNKILDRIVEPERIIQFRVEWEDDNHEIQVNRGWRVQYNSAIGPYKGGLRFHANVTLGTLKFLGFEQIFKNSLTTLPMGGGKGGSDFSPRGKSDAEIMRFCRAFMTELEKYIGPDTDVPAGDLGVGGREIGYLYGTYRKIRNENTGVLTGKGWGWGGSRVRPEATGYGTMYFANEMLKEHNDSFEGKRVAISGFGNVAWGAVTKATQLGAKVVTLSGPDGYILDEEGVNTPEKIAYMLELRASVKKIAKENAKKISINIPKLKDCKFHLGQTGPHADMGERSMIFLTEGDSASGTLNTARDVMTQAVFSLRGKPLNTNGMAMTDMYKNAELYNVMAALGIENGIEGLRYSKVIFATDADIDGFHIRILLLTYFLSYFEDLIHAGRVWILDTPLFRVRNKNVTTYCYSEEERDNMMKQIKGSEVTRFKGLGEISAKEFGQFIGEDMRLIPVTVDSLAEARRAMNFYMGNNTPERRDFIMENLV